jgi:hypothetical protein
MSLGEAMSTSRTTSNPVRRHRRDIWLRIVAPVVVPALLLVALCIVLLIAVARDELVSTQISVVMGIVATAFIALPLAILCVIPYAILAVTAVGAGRLYGVVTGPLQAVRRMTGKAARQTDRFAPKIARPFIGLNTRITRWEHTIRGWQGKDASDERPS